MADAKMLIVGTVLKQKGLFRPRDIIHETGIGSPLVTYHLKQLLDTALIDKTGPHYLVTDQEGMVDLLAKTSGEPDRKGSAYGTPFFSDKSAKFLNKFIKQVKALRALKYDETLDLKKATVEAIDASIDSLKCARKGLTQNEMTESQAIKYIYKEYDTFASDFWSIAFGEMGKPVNKQKLNEAIAHAVSMKEED